MSARLRELRWLILLLFLSLLVSVSPGRALENGLALTPPMGWNSWNRFACNVNEDLVKSAADALVSSSMKDAGYQYVVIDDCWQLNRDAAGNIIADAKTFPSGIKALADYVHSKGLKFGIYSDAGTKTCAGRPGSRGHEYQDALQYAAWGVDYLKYDWCNTGTENAQAAYSTMRDALEAAGRPIVFSICNWGVKTPWRWGPTTGNLWRTTGDINDTYDRMALIGFGQNGLEKFAGPGHWNDPDMLEVGNGGMKRDEYRTHMALWAILAAPLLAGNDLRSMSPETKELLMNSEILAVDQDAKGVQGRRVWQEGPLEIWVKPLADGSQAVGLFNRSESATKMTLDFKSIGAPASAKLRDLLDHKDLGTIQNSYSTDVPTHGVVLVKVSR